MIAQVGRCLGPDYLECQCWDEMAYLHGGCQAWIRLALLLPAL